MKNKVFLLSIFLASIFTACASHDQLVKEPPFKINKAFAKGDQTKIMVHLDVTEMPEDVELLALYYNKRKCAIVEKEGKYIAEFIIKPSDIILSNDMSAESQNTIPQLPEESPVGINATQALLVYNESGKEWYYIIDEITRE